MSNEIGIGSRVWEYDQNNRVYAPNSRGGPIFSEHFLERWIVGEEARSWIVDSVPPESPRRGWQRKIGKAKVASDFYTDAERDDEIYVHDNRVRLGDAVIRMRCEDATTLRRIAAIIDGTTPNGCKVLAPQENTE